MNYMETFYTMVDCYSRGYYEVKSQMPQIALYDAQTLNQVVNLSDLLLNMNEDLWDRAQLFCGVMVIVNSV